MENDETYTREDLREIARLVAAEMDRAALYPQVAVENGLAKFDQQSRTAKRRSLRRPFTPPDEPTLKFRGREPMGPSDSSITDEMVDRAARALWQKTSSYPYERLIPVTVEDLRDYARLALVAAREGGDSSAQG